VESSVGVVEWRLDELVVFPEIGVGSFELVEVRNGHHHVRPGEDVDGS